MPQKCCCHHWCHNPILLVFPCPFFCCSLVWKDICSLPSTLVCKREKAGARPWKHLPWDWEKIIIVTFANSSAQFTSGCLSFLRWCAQTEVSVSAGQPKGDDSWILQTPAALQSAIDTCGHGGHWEPPAEGAVSSSSAKCRILSTWHGKAFGRYPERNGERRAKEDQFISCHDELKGYGLSLG